MDHLTIKEHLQQGPQKKDIIVHGWLRYLRKQSKMMFGHIYDGSSAEDLQLIIDRSQFSDQQWVELKKLDTGSAVKLIGLMVDSPKEGQKYELQVLNYIIYGQCDMSKYPLVPKKDYPADYVRRYPHLRPRIKVTQSRMRIRSALDLATHLFFQNNGYLRLHTPVITGNDCEGAGEVFEVKSDARWKMSYERIKQQQSNEVQEAIVETLENETNADQENTDQQQSKEELQSMIEKLNQTDQVLDKLSKEEREKLEEKRKFFGKTAFLTVSGQLDAESYACGMGKVYTFGPTFRAENSVTYRHLAEFWMIEPEMAFMDIHEDMEVAQAYVQFCLTYVLDNFRSDLEFLEKSQDTESALGLVARLESIVKSDFPRVTYTKAIELLKAEVANKGLDIFENPEIEWGMDMASEHEKHLVKHCFNDQPIIVYQYPSAMKAFYMHENEPDEEGHQTVAAMDMLVPGIGELIGGSQREVRMDVLLKKMSDANLNPSDYQEYLDLREYGNVPHSGFGLGFERLVMLATGTHHIRDVIPFPRASGCI